MEYCSGDPILIKNIVTQLKSQGIFDQFRKECIADVDTKPAYQNLCHLADTQVSKFLSKVKWGPDVHKNQIRENLRRQVNECNFVEPGIAIIVDQLVNPRINTVLVPKVEDMLYKYLGIPREIPSEVIRRDRSFNDRTINKSVSDSSTRGSSAQENVDRRKDTERPSYSGDSTKEKAPRNDTSNKTQLSTDKSRDSKPSNIATESVDTNVKDTGKPTKPIESEKHEEVLPPLEFDTESSDEEMSPPYEPHEKSDNDMSIGSGDSNYSEIIDPKTLDPDIPIETEIENICQTEDSKIVTEHEDSMDSLRSHHSTHSVPEKITISPIEIPKTPTINYETSEDSDDNLKKKLLESDIALEACAEPLDIPEVNFDKIVEKVIEDNSEDVKPFEKIDVSELKPVKEEDNQKLKDKNRSDDSKKKYKHKDDKSKSVDKDKHGDKKHERSDRDRSKSDKYKSEHRSKDRDKDKSRHDSKSHRKDDKSHRSKERDHKSDHDKKPKSDYKKDDRSENKKDDKEPKKDDKTEHKKDERKREHSRDDRKKDRKSTSDDKKPKIDDKHKHDKPRDDKKTKDGDHLHKSKKKDDDSKKSRSHCNVDEKKKTDRRSSDRDSSGPSTSNPSSVHTSAHHSTKTDKDKGSKHRHSSSSSSHKTKKNDDREKDRDAGKPSEPVSKIENLANDDDLEMILQSSPEKAPNDIKIDVFTKKSETEAPTAESTKTNDHIEDMMNEIFQPKLPKPATSITEESKTQISDPVDLSLLKKPKIAKNFADIRRIMKLRKLYKESFKLKEEQGKENANLSTSTESSNDEKIKLRKTVEYFVTRRFGKNGSNVEKCKELTNAIMETLTDVKLNITRVDRRYPIVDGTCILNDEKKIDENGLSSNDDDSVNQDVENLQIIHDERANLILEDLAKSCITDFKIDESSEEKLPDSEDGEKALKIINSCPETKANGAKTKLTKLLQVDIPQEVNLQMQINAVDNLDASKSESDDTSPSLKLKFKSIYDGKNKTWHACENVKEVVDPVHYLSPPSTDERFKQFVEELIDNQLDMEVENLVVEMEYPECYDAIFTSQLGAKVVRKRVASPIKYNSEIISKKMGDKSIMLRIKKTSECDDNEKLKKIKVDDSVEPNANESVISVNDSLDSSVNGTPDVENKKAPVKRKNENVKRKTLGIKRSLVSSITNSNSLKMKLITETVNKTESDINSTNEQIESPTTDVKPKNTLGVKKVVKGKNKNVKGSAVVDFNHKRSESESSDGRRSSVSSTGNTHSKNAIDEAATPVAAKNKTKNNSSIESPNTDVATTTKATDQPKKADTKSSEERQERRKQSILNCYYDQSDLYKPRPTVRLTSRRYQNNTGTT